MKKYNSAATKVEKTKLYNLSDAIKLAKDTSFTKFDGTINIALNLNLDTKQANQQLRGSISLPNGIGKTKKIAVITTTKIADAEKAGADFVGSKDLLEKIKNENWFGFDVLLATPEMMAEIGKLGKILGPKGLMPNPKDGTVTMDVAKAIDEIKKGKASFRTDKDGNIHSIIGLVSFTEEKLLENLETFVNSIKRLRPSVVKGKFIKSATLSATMGPGIRLQVSDN